MWFCRRKSVSYLTVTIQTDQTEDFSNVHNFVEKFVWDPIQSTYCSESRGTSFAPKNVRERTKKSRLGYVDLYNNCLAMSSPLARPNTTRHTMSSDTNVICACCQYVPKKPTNWVTLAPKISLVYHPPALDPGLDPYKLARLWVSSQSD